MEGVENTPRSGATPPKKPGAYRVKIIGYPAVISLPFVNKLDFNGL